MAAAVEYGAAQPEAWAGPTGGPQMLTVGRMQPGMVVTAPTVIRRVSNAVTGAYTPAAPVTLPTVMAGSHGYAPTGGACSGSVTTLPAYAATPSVPSAPLAHSGTPAVPYGDPGSYSYVAEPVAVGTNVGSTPGVPRYAIAPPAQATTAYYPAPPVTVAPSSAVAVPQYGTVMSYVPPPMTAVPAVYPSYVGPAMPQGGVLAFPAPVPAPLEEPKPPPNLTQGIPDPDSIDRQKAAYAKGLDEQLKHGTEVLAQQLKQQSEYLLAVGDQQKRQYSLSVDQQIKQQEMLLAQQHNEQLLMLQQAAQQQKSALEQQASALILEFHQRRAQEELLQQQYEYQKQHYESQLQYHEDLKQLQAQQAAPAQQAVVPGGSIAGSYSPAHPAAPVYTAVLPPRVSSYAPPPAPPPPPVLSHYLVASSSSYAPPPTVYGPNATTFVQAAPSVVVRPSSVALQVPATVHPGGMTAGSYSQPQPPWEPPAQWQVPGSAG